MAGINWAAMKDQYEIMHTDVKELATSHNVSESVIQLAIRDGGWKREDTNSTEVSDISDRLTLMQARNQAALVPKFISLQNRLLDKCSDLLEDVDGINDASNLRLVAEIIEKHRPAIMAMAKDRGTSDNSMNIRIMTTAGSGDRPSVAAVEITQSAGTSNGIGAVSVN